MILQVIIALVAGWINRHQQQVITYLKEENRVLKSKLPGGRLRLTDTERRRLAKLAHPLIRKQLKDTATIATPDTLIRWYKQLIACKFDGSKKRNGPGRPRVDEEIEQLVVRMAEDNRASQAPKAPGWPVELLSPQGRMNGIVGQPIPMLSIKYSHPDISTLRDESDVRRECRCRATAVSRGTTQSH